MKYIFYVFSLLFITGANSLCAQSELVKGTVSYVSSQNVYVKFASTKKINIGDTLFLQKGEALLPALRVSNKSSISCVCTRLTDDIMQVSTEIVSRQIPEKPKVAEVEKEETLPIKNPTTKPVGADKTPAQAVRDDHGLSDDKKLKQKIRARLSAASYTNHSDRGDNTRMRYAFTMQGNNLGNSRISTDAYVTFRHTLNEWDAVKGNLNDALKIYSLAVRYDFSETTNLTLGRKINAKISSLGAIDGVQYEQGIGKKFLVGAIAGSRPDMLDYSINTDLVQAGVYLGQISGKKERFQQSTLGILEQRNKSAVDRRFVYFQHSDDLLKNLNIFTSCELELYEKINNETKTKVNLTNLFVSLRYRFSKKLNASISYDSRKNIIYYESYKNYIDQLIDNETRQGFRAGVNIHPIPLLTWGINASWRFQQDGSNSAKNANSYLNFSRIPLIKTSLSITANYLRTSYINSRVFGARMSKDFFKGKVNGEVYYRKVNYVYPLYGYTTKQDIVGSDVSFQIGRHIGIYAFFEQTLDSQGNDYTMINTKIMYRF